MVNGEGQTKAPRRALSQYGDGSRTNNLEKPTVKRSRVSRACDQCRASREKCDGRHPRCQTCVTQGRTCSYNEQPKKRGIQPNYIRTLELTLAWILQTYPSAERGLVDALPATEHHVRRLISGRDSDASEILHSAFRDSLVYKQLEQMLLGNTVDSVGQNLGVAHNETPDADMAFPSLSSHTPPSITRPTPTQLATGEARQIQNSLVEAGALYQLPDDAWMYLDYYFAFTHSWLPMTDKSGLLKSMYCYPSQGLSRDALNAAEHAELWAIMALVAAQRDYDTSGRHSFNAVQERAESLLPSGSAPFELPHIRALIILALIDMLHDHMLAAWLRIGTAVRLLHLFKLVQHLGQTTPWCRHIHLVAFVLESALALHFGTRAHLTPEYVKGVGYVDEDGMEEWAPWQDPLVTIHQGARAPARSLSTLNELVRRHVKWVEEQSAADMSLQATDSSRSVVLALIRNAAASMYRLQPSILLASPSNATGQWLYQSDDTALDPTMEASGLDINLLTSQGAEPSTGSQSHRRVMRVSHGTTVQSDSILAPVVSSDAPWNAQASLNSVQAEQAEQAVSPESYCSYIDAGSAELFEELANLEPQNSMQQPQFLRNLGFGPDLDLAEFFGADYQMSDPLLSYVQPPLHNVRTSGSGISV